jgi:hypothetical protein
MFHVKHLKSKLVIWFGFSQYYLSETRPEPPPQPTAAPIGELPALTPCSINEKAGLDPKPCPGCAIPDPWPTAHAARADRSVAAHAARADRNLLPGIDRLARVADPCRSSTQLMPIEPARGSKPIENLSNVLGDFIPGQSPRTFAGNLVPGASIEPELGSGFLNWFSWYGLANCRLPVPGMFRRPASHVESLSPAT